MAKPDIKSKIAALKAKTKAAGCTEGEAMAAAELAAKLMDKHGLDEAELVMTEASTMDRAPDAAWRIGLSTAIAYCTNTSAVIVKDRHHYSGGLVLFVGRDPGPEIALYLRDICFRAVDAEVKSSKASTFYRRRRSMATRRDAARDFRQGLVMRLSTRLLKVFGPTLNDAARQDAKGAVQKRFEGAVTIGAPQHKQRYSAAGDAGWCAGGAIPLNRGVATPERRRLAGGA